MSCVFILFLNKNKQKTRETGMPPANTNIQQNYNAEILQDVSVSLYTAKGCCYNGVTANSLHISLKSCKHPFYFFNSSNFSMKHGKTSHS